MFIPDPLILMPSNSKPKIISSAVGRRREAIASVRLISSTAEMTVNDLPVSVYFPGIEAKLRYELPFATVSLPDKFSATAMVHGGGKNGQLDALVLGLSRALADYKAEFKKPLRDAGLLTRDPRTRQRRMVGMGGKSRRKKQSPKR
jgi:small subunit ribosomal protein S9